MKADFARIGPEEERLRNREAALESEFQAAQAKLNELNSQMDALMNETKGPQQDRSNLALFLLRLSSARENSFDPLERIQLQLLLSLAEPDVLLPQTKQLIFPEACLISVISFPKTV